MPSTFRFALRDLRPEAETLRQEHYRPRGGEVEGMPQATIAMVNGHAVGAGWAARFLQLAGPVRTKEITMGGRRHGTDDACDLGLVNRVTPGTELGAAVQDYAAMPARNRSRRLPR